jgi:hypothetical protein
MMMNWRSNEYMVDYGRALVMCMLDQSVSVEDYSGSGPVEEV